MAWSERFPLTGQHRPSAIEMQNIRAAVVERDAAMQLGLFGGHGLLEYPPDITGLTSKLAGIHKFQNAIAGPTALVCGGAGYDPWSYWHGPLSTGLKRLVTAPSPLAGELNLFMDAGLSATDWRKKKTDPVHIRHPNDCYAVLNRLVRLQTLWTVLAADNTYRIGKTATDPGWTVARTAGFTGQTGAGGGVDKRPILGRCGEDWTVPPETDYTIIAETSQRATATFNTAALGDNGWTLAKAYVVIGKAALLSHDYPDELFEDFNFRVKIGLSTFRTLNSGDAADLADFRFNYGICRDAWVVEIPIDFINPGGDTVITLEYADDPLADPVAYTGPNECVYYSNGWLETDDIHASLVLERADWEYKA